MVKQVIFPDGTIALGASGMTGCYIYSAVPNFDLDNGYDITKPGVLQKIFKEHKPKVVLLLAAMTDVVGAETDANSCFTINSTAVYWTARLCKSYGAKLVFISSVDVFDGEKETPYKVYDEPNPIVVYGHSKASAEAIIKGTLSDYCIVRAGWMFGGEDKDKKFVSYMIKQMLVENKQEIKAVYDRRGSATYAFDLIRKVADLIVNDARGTFHFCNSGAATRYEEALVIAGVLEEKMLWQGSIVPVSMSEFPKFRALKNALLESSFPTRSWQEALKEYINDWI